MHRVLKRRNKKYPITISLHSFITPYHQGNVNENYSETPPHHWEHWESECPSEWTANVGGGEKREESLYNAGGSGNKYSHMEVKFFKMKKKIGQAYDPAISLLGDENSTFYIEIFVNLSLLLLYLR